MGGGYDNPPSMIIATILTGTKLSGWKLNDNLYLGFLHVYVTFTCNVFI